MIPSLTAPAFLATEIAVAARAPGAARTLLLDVDGTLAPISATPEMARVPVETLTALERLVDLGWSVAVVSGRPAAEVRAMVPVRGVRVFGSHGAEDANNEEPARRPSNAAAEVLSTLAAGAERLATRTPGARIEVKPAGLAFHDRMVPRGELERWRKQLRAMLESFDLEGLEVIEGRRVTEVRLRGVHKGTVLRHLAPGPERDVPDASLVAIGDDTTDEDLFRALAGRGLPILVARRSRATAAARRLSSPAAVREFLDALVERSRRDRHSSSASENVVESETPEFFRRRASEPFKFIDYEGLVMPTGRRAANLKELIDLVRTVPPEVLHHHLHRTPLSHRFGVWDYPNDLAQWAARSLEDLALAEKLAALDPYVHAGLEEAREAILEILEEHLDALPIVPWARPGFEFHFASGYFLALPGDREVWTLVELREALAEVPLSSLYYHFHEARLRVAGDESDDFSRWIEGQLGPHPIVGQLRGIDFFFFSLEDLRQRILSILDQHMGGGAA
jgi:trehalose-phosphatase